MAIDLERFNQLKKMSEKARSEADRAAGVLDDYMAKLRTEYSVDTIEAAEALLAELVTAEQDAEQRYNAALADFEMKWKGRV